MSGKQAGEIAFNEAYATLNAAQKEAVDATEGPVMVIAGPGTGKTQILTLRIANILQKTDTQPENILALTFTEAGARTMRERLRTYIGAEAYRTHVHTFHGFCETLIRRYPDAYERVVGGRPATDVEKIDLMQSIIDGGDIRLLRPIGDPTYYTTRALDAIQTMKREYITPEGLSTIIAAQEQELAGMEQFHEKGAHKGKVRGEYSKKEKSISKNKELLFLYRGYEALLVEKRLYDFEDMIVETVRALEAHEDMLRDLQETYQYLLADEHQDVNGSQNRILELLASYHSAPNIFVVGDEKQAIFRFQGASLENFLYFEDVFAGTKTIALTKNYRSGQVILDVAHELIQVDEGPAKALRVPLVAAGKAAKASVERHDFSHQAVEDDCVVTKIETELAEGIPPEEIAVIVRTNREVEAFAALLRKRGIPVTPSADSDILEHPITRSVQHLIAATGGDEAALFATLHAAHWSVGADDLARVCGARSLKEPLSAIIKNPERLTALGVEQPDTLLRVGSVLATARKKDGVLPPHEVLEYLVNESGLLSLTLEEDPEEGARIIRRLYDEVEAMVTQNHAGALADVSMIFTRRRAHGLPLVAPFINTKAEAVKVMTAHKSKGLEFHTVIIPHLVDSLWGGAVRRTHFDIPLTKHLDATVLDATDDERRLLYVALTRAKSKLLLSCSSTNRDAKEFVPTRLFEYMSAAKIDGVDTTALEKGFDPSAALMGTARPPAFSPEYLKTRFLERGLSATALNNYLASPWDYFYRNVLRIPEIQNESMLFGTAMHGVLDRVVAYHTKEGKLPSDSAMSEYLKTALMRLPITHEQYTQLHEKGFAALSVYMRHLGHVLPPRAEVEFPVHVPLQTGDSTLPEIPLTGKLDRLDFNEDGNVVRVIDYKTGKPKSRNAIEGKTKDGNGNYKRQIVFYALLLSLFDDERYACREGVISFLEPDTKGSVREEAFTVTDAEIEELKKEIVRVSKEIVTGAFLTEPCDPSSPYAPYVELLQRSAR